MKTNPSTGRPFTDDELQHYFWREKKPSASASASTGLSGPLEARELLFDSLQGLDDIVLSVYEKDFCLKVENAPERKPLNHMAITYRLNIHPFEGKTLKRGVFEKTDIRANQDGKIIETIPVVDFYEGGSVDYAVVLSYET
ncbi:hypothetical protein, partial [Sansalvadorimonas verongulae]|uniref:hypothetical protein n=1 Tax=Sansalvadorimonas verongulae TaxID=2172824 RepID=UPI0018AD18B2